jgi:hypothetical protein
MGFFDRVADAYDKFKEWDNKTIPGPADSFSAIGSAYTTAAHSPFGTVVGEIVKPVANAAGTTLDVMGYPLDKVKRGISTGSIVSQRDGGTVFSTELWKDAWHKSETISAGQALDIGIEGDLAKIPGVIDDRPDFMKNGDPFSPENAKARKEYFDSTFSGKLNSGAIDLILDFTVDPTAIVGAGVKGARIAANTIKEADRIPALAASLGKADPNISKSAARSGLKLSNLYDKTDNLTAAEMATMPEFKKSGDAGAIAYFMEFANKNFADKAQRHAFKADIMGSVLGDTDSIAAVKNFQTDIANQIERAGVAPKNMSYLSKYSSSDYGAAMISAAQADEAGVLDALKAERTADVVRLDRILDIQASSNKVGSTLAEHLGARANNDKFDQNLTSKISEYVSPNGLFGAPVRYVIGRANMRVPGYVNIKDPTQGYDQLLNTLGQMKHTPIEARRDLANQFVRASNEAERREVVQATESRMFADYGTKYGLDQKTVEKFMAEARGRRASYQQGLKDRLYSAAEPDKIIQFYDPEDDMTHVFDKAFLQTHFDNNHELTDPSTLDSILQKGTNRRALERFAKSAKDTGSPRAEAIATGASDLLDASAQTTQWVLDMGTRLWKDAALMRLAYPVRIQMDTQARTLVHLGMMQYLMTRKQVIGGQIKYLLENAEGEKSLKNLFKEGDLDAALAKQLKPTKGAIKRGEDKFLGYDIYPAKDAEDIQRIRAGIASHGGAAADIGNDIVSADLRRIRGTGSWDKIKAGTPEWFENWQRAADQIRTSPTARKSLEIGDVDSLREWVNKTPEGRKEWQAVAATNSDQNEWLSKVINHAHQYLPTPELRATIDNPAKARDLFDLRSAEERVAAIPGLKARKAETTQTVADVRARLKDLRAQYEALPKRSPERRALNVEIKQLRASHKLAKSERWQARAELGDAKKPPNAGEVNPISGKVEPMDVHGENYSPLAKTNGLDAYAEGLRTRWYGIMADVPETIMGRSPIYVDTYKQYMKDAISRLGEDGIEAAGIDRIRRAADRRARQEVASILFDASHTSNAAHAMRFVAPFFSAWEDTMRKWGKLMYENPTVPLTAHKVWDSPENTTLFTDSTWVHDSEGNYKENGKYYNAQGKEISKEDYAKFGEYIVLPKLWGKNSKDPNQGGSFKLNRTSLNVLFQGNPPWLPGLGPLVQIPTNEIVKRSFPEYANNPVLKYALPFGITDDSVPYQLLPSWMKQVRDSMGGSKDYAQTYAMLFAQENTLYATGQRKSKPTVEEVQRRTRNWFLLRAGLANASPVSIQPTPKLQFYIDKAHDYRSQYGAKWQEKFYDDFPQYFDMSLSLSYNDTGIQATDKAYNATQKFRKEIRDNPDLGWFFVGPDNLNGQFDANINTWQRSTEAGQGKNFRSAKNPDAALKQVQAEKGWLEYDKVSRAVNLVLESRGLHSLQQKGAEDLATAMQQYKLALSQENSAWAEQFGQRDSGKVQKMFSVAEQAWKRDPGFAKRPDQKALADYLQVRNAVRALLQSRPTKSLEHPDNADVANVWNQYLTEMKQSPGFEQIWNRMLQADDLSQEIQ